MSNKPKVSRSSPDHWTKDPRSSSAQDQGAAKAVDKQWYRVGKLSQYGRNGSFHEAPRWETESELSMIQGEVDVSRAWELMVGKSEPPKGSEIRVFEAEALITAEYRVWKSPTRKNPIHASVGAPVETSDKALLKDWWNNLARVKLDTLQEVSDAVH